MMRRPGGFTLVELVITFVVVGIMSAVVLANIDAKARHSVTAQADEFRRNLSHLQLLAISQGLRLRLSVNAGGTNYTVVSCTTPACTSTNPVVDPATGLNFSVDLIDDVTLSPASDTLDFDSLGRPVSGAALLPGTPNPGDPARSYTLSGSGRQVIVTVLPITGFARTTY